MFKALLVDRKDKQYEAAVAQIDYEKLPKGDVTIDVDYSSLNYKDGLAVTGKGKIIRGDLPFVPGIDLAGTVSESESEQYQPGDKVIVTGWGIGEKTWGGFSQRARVRSEWIVRLPQNLSTHEAMIFGTAGLTAMLAVMSLEAHGTKQDSSVVVSGASGGVGSFAVAILSRYGYRAVASTGSRDSYEYLTELGAVEIIDRNELPAAAPKALDVARWGGAVDTVGGTTLAGILSQLESHASVAACGNAGGAELHTSVFPFILRGVNLLGVDSNTAPHELRTEAWRRLADDVPRDVLKRIESAIVSLEELPEKCEEITHGRVEGRVVVDVNR